MLKINDIQEGTKLRVTKDYGYFYRDIKYKEGDTVTIEEIRKDASFKLYEDKDKELISIDNPYFELLEKKPNCRNCRRSIACEDTCSTTHGSCSQLSGLQNWLPKEDSSKDIVIGDKILIKEVDTPGTVILNKTYVVKDCSSKDNQNSRTQFLVNGENVSWWVWKKDIELMENISCDTCAYCLYLGTKEPCCYCHDDESLPNWQKYKQETGHSFEVYDKVICIKEEGTLIKNKIYTIKQICDNLLRLMEEPFSLYHKDLFKPHVEKVTEFVTGKYYKWIGGSERPTWFVTGGKMDAILDGKPHKCIYGEGCNALFEGQEGNMFHQGMWTYTDGMTLFEEVSDSEYIIKYVVTSTNKDWTVQSEGYHYGIGSHLLYNPYVSYNTCVTDVSINTPEGYTASLTEDIPFNFGKENKKERRGGFMNFLKSFIPSNYQKQEKYGVFDSYGNLDYSNKLVAKRLHALISDGLDEDIKALEEEEKKNKKK